MHTRFAMVAAAVLAAASGASAEPIKTPRPQAASAHPAPVVLASADHVAPAPADAGSPPSKPHRAARVTTCRCGGDPQPEQPDSPEQ